MAEQKPPLVVEFKGDEYEFPADATDAQISRFLKAIPSQNAKDVPKAETWTAKHPTIAAAARGVLNALPAAAGLGAAAAFAPAELASGGLGVIPSLALGAGVGRGARDLIAEAAGLDEPSSALGKAGRIALDVGETAATQAVVPGAVEALKTPLRTTGDVLKTFPQLLPRALRPSLPAGLRMPPRPAGPILARPPWQVGEAAAGGEGAAPVTPSADAVKEEFKAFLKAPAEPATRLKLTSTETALGFRLMKRGLTADQALELIKIRRSLPAAWKALPTDEEVEAIVKQANQTGRMTR